MSWRRSPCIKSETPLIWLRLRQLCFLTFPSTPRHESGLPREAIENPPSWSRLKESHRRSENGEGHPFVQFSAGLSGGKTGVSSAALFKRQNRCQTGVMRLPCMHLPRLNRRSTELTSEQQPGRQSRSQMRSISRYTCQLSGSHRTRYWSRTTSSARRYCL